MSDVTARRAGPRTVGIYAAVMALLLIVLAVGGDNGVVYGVILLGAPIGSGILAGLQLIRFWHAVVGCLAVVALDVAFDETRTEDLVFFAVLALVMVGIAALARLVTRWMNRDRSRIPDQPAGGSS